MSQNHNKFTVCFAISLFKFIIVSENSRFFQANSPWIQFFREINLISLSYSRNHYEYTIFREINMNSLSVSLIHFECTIFSLNQYKFTICIAISIWKHYLFRAFALNPLFTAKSQWYHYLLRVSPWIHNFFRELTICLANFRKSLWTQYEITMIHYW